MTKPINVLDQALPIDELLPIIAEAVNAWKKENSAERIKKRTKDLLEKNSQEITLKLLGFDTHWGRWEIDHCNGRSGNSAAGDFLRKTQAEAINEWLSSLSLTELSTTQLAEIKKSALDEYSRCIHKYVFEGVREKAKTVAQELIDAITQSNHIESYEKTLKLLMNQEITDAS